MKKKWFLCLIVIFGIYICNHWEYLERLWSPGMFYVVKGNTTSWLEKVYQFCSPLYAYTLDIEETVVQVEDHLTYEMLLQQQAADEDRLAEDLEQIEEAPAEPVQSVSLEQLKDFSYLLSKYYTVDSTTSVSEELLNAETLLGKDMHIDVEKEGPKVLIFHTHSQEAFWDSVSGDSNTTIVGMGAYLSELLNEKGIETMHHSGVYDLINGKLDRSSAYQYAVEAVQDILNENPSIEVVIDLHRDGVGEDKHLVTEIDGEQTAKIMYFNGLSYTKANGSISYLPNPYIQDNLAFSLQMQLATEQLYPNLARKIYLKGYRYSLHMMPKSLLIEAGAQTNTVSEMRNAMKALANVLEQVLVK